MKGRYSPATLCEGVNVNVCVRVCGCVCVCIYICLNTNIHTNLRKINLGQWHGVPQVILDGVRGPPCIQNELKLVKHLCLPAKHILHHRQHVLCVCVYMCMCVSVRE